MKRFTFIIILVFNLISCSKDNSETTITTTTNQQITVSEGTNATVNLTVINSAQQPQANYTIMMFDRPINQENNLPEILMKKISDLQGKVSFDLENFIQNNGEKKYYFEAFKEVNGNYVWKSVTHPNFDVKPKQVHTSSIIVN